MLTCRNLNLAEYHSHVFIVPCSGQVPVQLKDYSMTSVSEGIEALAHTRVVVRPAGTMADQAYVQSAQGQKYQRTFSGKALVGHCEAQDRFWRLV